MGKLSAEDRATLNEMIARIDRLAWKWEGQEDLKARVVQKAVFYLDEPHLPPARNRAADAAIRFREIVGDDITTVSHRSWDTPQKGDDFPIDSKKVMEPHDALLEGHIEHSTAFYEYSDVSDSRNVGSMFFGADMPAIHYYRGHRYMGLVEIGFAMGWLAKNAKRVHFRDIVLEFARILQPRHGSAGYDILFPGRSDYTKIAAQNGTFREFLSQHPGIDANDHDTGYFPPDMKKRLDEHLRTVNWLTLIGDPLLERIGGRENVEATLFDRETYPLFEYGEGLIIQAGMFPNPGNRELNIIPHEYGEVARLTAPIRVHEFDSDHFSNPMGGPYRDPHEEARKWLARFDDA